MARPSLRWIARMLVLTLTGMLAFGFTLGWLSRHQVPNYLPTPGTQLRPCPARPNCVMSTAGEADHRVEPLWRARPDPPAPAWNDAITAITARHGTVQQQRPGYLWAVFTSPLLGFVDDVEILVDPEGNWQVRSASRLGYSDLGVNRTRVDALRQAIVDRSNLRP